LKKYLAFDIGASSGRVIVGIIDDGILRLDEIYRFPNGGVQVFDSMYWDMLRLFQEIKNGILEYVKKYGSELDSIGLDTWGVDFVLLNERDEPAGPIHTYRDKRTNGMLEKMFQKIPKEEIFNQTGIQFMPINTSTQMFSMVYNNCPELEITKTFLMIPDYFNFLLSGVKCSEYSEATTSQLFNPITNNWAYDLIEKLGLKKEWFCEIKDPGTILGPIQKDIAEETGISPNTLIIAPLCHDTGSAVAAIPVEREKEQREWAYISSGTWSLLGVELEKPLINKKAMLYNYTNEGGINKTSRFLKNLTGLWLIQECKRLWDKDEMNLKWDEIEKRAESAPPFKYFINPDDICFLNPQNMIDEIKNYCKTYNQEIPESVGEIARTIYESMSFNYKRAVLNLEDILENKKVKILHIIGGGSRDNLLNQFTANALNVPVIAGPAETTAIGNILVQALALGEIKNINELRKVVKNSFQVKEYFPNNIDEWNKNYEVFLEKTS